MNLLEKVVEKYGFNFSCERYYKCIRQDNYSGVYINLFFQDEIVSVYLVDELDGYHTMYLFSIKNEEEFEKLDKLIDLIEK